LSLLWGSGVVRSGLSVLFDFGSVILFWIIKISSNAKPWWVDPLENNLIT
jgi:hypothetical protein